MPKLGHYDIDELKEEILQNFILGQLEHGRVDQTGGISHKYAKDIITVLKITINHDFKICLPYEKPNAHNNLPPYIVVYFWRRTA